MSVGLMIRRSDFVDGPSDSTRALKNSEAGTDSAGVKPFVAVGTEEGVLVDKHIGEVLVFQIWKPTEDGYLHVDDRMLPESAIGRERWGAIADALKDCRAVLVSGTGELPAAGLTDNSISVIVMNGFITTGLDAVYLGSQMALLKGRRRECRIGGECSGRGRGGRTSKKP